MARCWGSFEWRATCVIHRRRTASGRNHQDRPMIIMIRPSSIMDDFSFDGFAQERASAQFFDDFHGLRFQLVQ